MIGYGNTDMETPKKQTAVTTTDYVCMKPALLSLTENQAALLKMCFATKSFTLGSQTYLKKPLTTQEKLLVESLTSSENPLPDMDEDEPWHDETKEEYK